MTHCKRYTLASLVKSDLWGRAAPWTRLILKTHVVKSDLNLRPHNVASVPLSYLILASFVFARSPLPPASLIALFALLNYRFLVFVGRECGLGFALCAAALCWLGYLNCGVGAVLGAVQYVKARRIGALAVRDSMKT